MALVSDYQYESAEIFSYFDQFADYEVDLTKYLQNFSSDTYQLNLSSMQPAKVTLKNLFTKIAIEVDFKKYSESFATYVIIDGDDIFKISNDHYGKIDYWWLIYLLNDIMDPLKDWPLSHNELNRLAEILYTHEGKYTLETYYHLLFEQNEKKRIILLPSTNTVVDILTQFHKIKQGMN
jgi:hypothetical protein